MITLKEQERIEELEAKAFMKWGLSENEEEELGSLIAKTDYKDLQRSYQRRIKKEEK